MQRRGRTRSRRHLAARPPTADRAFNLRATNGDKHWKSRLHYRVNFLSNDTFARLCIVQGVKDQLAPDYHEATSRFHARQLDMTARWQSKRLQITVKL